MAIIKSNPVSKGINGEVFVVSDKSIISEPTYNTSGESLIIVRNINSSKIILNSLNTDRVTIKSMTSTLVIPDRGKIDEQYDEIILDNTSCVEFSFVGGNWYITSSDGLKY